MLITTVRAFRACRGWVSIGRHCTAAAPRLDSRRGDRRGAAARRPCRTRPDLSGARGAAEPARDAANGAGRPCRSRTRRFSSSCRARSACARTGEGIRAGVAIVDAAREFNAPLRFGLTGENDVLGGAFPAYNLYEGRRRRMDRVCGAGAALHGNGCVRSSVWKPSTRRRCARRSCSIRVARLGSALRERRRSATARRGELATLIAQR